MCDSLLGLVRVDNSLSPDQTTRIHAPVEGDVSLDEQVWHEICRPQVHGYDLNQAVFLDPTKFVSIADEKVARVFEAPKSFVSLAKHYKILDQTINEVCKDSVPSPRSINSRR